MRTGLGKLRHVDMHLLWLLQTMHNGEFRLFKIDGPTNPADILTKYVSQDDMHRHMNTLRFSVVEGRAAACPLLAGPLECAWWAR